MKFALINKENIVINIIIWPYGQFSAPDDHLSVESSVARLGDRYENGQFIAPDGSIRN